MQMAQITQIPSKGIVSTFDAPRSYLRNLRDLREIKI